MKSKTKSLPERIREWVELNENEKFWDRIEQDLIDAFTGNNSKAVKGYYKSVWQAINS